MQTLSVTEHEVLRQLTIRLMENWKKKDRQALDELLHQDFCFINDTIKDYCMCKSEWMEFILEKLELTDYNWDFQKIKLRDGGRMASVITKMNMLLKPGYNDNYTAYLITDIWVNNNGAWKLMIRQRISSLLIQ